MNATYVNQLDEEMVDSMIVSLRLNGETLESIENFYNSKISDIDDIIYITGHRKCSKCGELFPEGFMDDNKYYCSEECLYTVYTPEEWIAEYEKSEECGDGGGDYWAMWTQFYEF